MKRNVLFYFVSFIMLFILLAGCGDDSTLKFKDKETGAEYEVVADEEGNSKVTVETEDGKMVSETGSDAKIPDAFPSDFPWPNSMMIEVAQSLSDETTDTHTIMFSFDEDAEEIFEAMKSYATDHDLPINLEQSSEVDGEKYYLLNVGTEENGFHISIGNLAENAAMVVYFEPKK